jgi:hypothetical protein
VRRTLAQIEEAFADAPRPSNDDLLHERCSWETNNVADQAKQALSFWT